MLARPFAVHPAIVNKPATWQPSFASSWQTRTGTLAELRDLVSAGAAFIPAALSSEHRSSAAFAASSLAVVDIDHGLSVAAFLAHPLAASAAWLYTTASHNPAAGAERFRVVFQLPRRIEDPDLYKAIVTLLSRALGGDKSCTDPCRLFYGNSAAEHPLWQPEALLSGSILDDAAAEAQQARLRYDRATACYEERTLQQAIFVLEQVLAPTADGQRDHFIKVTAAASSGGDALYPTWSDWASRGHHGSGKNSRQASEKFFRGFHGRSSLATLFYLANEESPSWREALPAELRQEGHFSFSGFNVAGYDHEDFLGLWDEDLERGPLHDPATPGLFDAERPWLTIAAVPAPAPAATAVLDPAPPAPPGEADDCDPDDDEAGDLDAFDELLGGDAPPNAPAEQVVGRRGRRHNDNTVQQIKDLLLALYPGLRLNAMSLDLEYGPKDAPCCVHDISTAYVRVSRMAGTVFAKTLVYDVAQIIGHENQYHPVRTYLETASANAAPCPYFDRLATELLGLPEDPLLNPSFEDGRAFADVILQRFLIGAVARVLEPGCTHDWMPILIGGQNCGKSTFFQYLTPPDPSRPGNYPWSTTIQQGITYLKDKPHALHASWLVLLDEAERYFKRKYVEELKNLVSVSIDRSARKYENERNFYRSFVLCGATNNGDFLVDPTGNRRFMPIPIAGKVPSPQDARIKIIDLDRLKADRDAIWAAAYKAYLDGTPHTWSSYELSLMAPYLEGFAGDNPLDAKIDHLLGLRTSGVWKGQNYVLIADVMEWLEVPVAQQPSLQLAIADALKRLGYQLRRVRMGGPVRRIWIKAGPKDS